MLSWFSKRRREKNKKINPVEQLANVLREHGGMILDGKGRLSLTTPVLISLNHDFQQLTFGRGGIGNGSFQVIRNEGPNEDVPFIFDFVQKSPNLKLVSGPVCIPSPQLSLLPFRSLQLLEIHRVPIVYIHGLHHIAKHVKTLICHRSTNSIKDVIYQFGRDFNGVLTLPELETLDLSYNTITCLDQSLKLLPSLENVDLCYNCLTSADSESIPPVKYLNLGYNSITKIPSYPLIVCYSLNKLTLCNNSLTTLEGIELLRNLETLDISSNCLVNFDDLLPLARLQFLISLNAHGNPLQFMPKYRQETVSRLSPIARMKTITLDGQMLNDTELLILGMNVQPPPLTSYIPNKPMGRPSGSLLDLTNSVSSLAERDPVVSSTPNGIGSKGPSHKRKSVKVRDAPIFDHSAQIEIESREHSTPSEPTKSFNESIGQLERLERQNSFSSRRSSIDDSILWIHKNSSGKVVEVAKSLQDIDYATQLDQEQLTIALVHEAQIAEEQPGVTDESIYSQKPVKIDIDSLSETTESSISVVSSDDKDDDLSVYLVESVIGGDKNCMDEKESLFISFKHPYLLEKDPVTGEVVKLDLNYLQEVIPFPNGVQRVSLRFDLVRSDRRKRLYLFEDIDNIQEFDNFISHLTPIALKNKQIKELSLENYQCLKCWAMFQKQKMETSFILCPNCCSSMIVEKTVNPTVVEGNSEFEQNEYGEGIAERTKLGVSPFESISLASNAEIKSNDGTLVRKNSSSIEVLARIGESDSRNVSVSTADPTFSPNCNTASTDEENGKPHELDTPVTAVIKENGLECQENMSSSNKIVVEDQNEIVNISILSENKQSDGEQIDKLQAILKSRISGSTLSVESSGGKGSVEGSGTNTRCSTPSNSESRFSKSGKTPTMSPFQGSSNSDIVVNPDDPIKCDHRLKLYFTMDLFKGQDEDFRCLIKCPYVRYDRANTEDCLLVVSTSTIYLFKLRCASSDSAKEWINLLVKYKFTELKYIDYCYFNQSFRLEFERELGSFKFLIGDAERCQKFVSLLLRVIQNGVADKQCLPIVLEDPNPRTLSNVKSQIFGLQEDLLSVAKRLFEQATVFTCPSLLKSKKIRMRTHQCVSGKDLVSWLVSRREAKSRKDAIALCQKLVDVGLLYHVSKELQFEDTDVSYKFDFSDNPKKMSSAVLQKIGRSGSNNSEYSQGNLDELEINMDVNLYLLVQTRISNDDSSLVPSSIFMTKSHLFVAAESHQWPLSRLYQPPSFLKEQFKLLCSQRIIDLVKITFFEDSPNHLMLEFVDELGDVDSRESTWLIFIETVRELERLANTLKTVWEEEIKVELFTEVLPTIELFL